MSARIGFSRSNFPITFVAPEQEASMTTTKGYVVLDKAGEFVAWAEHPEVAKRRLDADDTGHHVLRCSDDALIAKKPDMKVRGPR